MSIDWNLNAGNILTILAIMSVGFGFYYRQVYDGKQFKVDIADIKVDLKELNKIVIALAVQKERIDSQDKRMDNQGQHINRLYKMHDDLSRGRGYLQREIDGEYTSDGKIP